VLKEAEALPFTTDSSVDLYFTSFLFYSFSNLYHHHIQGDDERSFIV
jgi:hypothetical protein